MKRITTILKTMFLAAVVLVMAQGCIPTAPTGGNPTPNPQSNIIYKIFEDTLYPNSQSDNYFIAFDSIKPLEVEFWSYGFVPRSCFISRNDTTIKFLKKVNNTSGINPWFSIAKYEKANNNSTSWADNRMAILGQAVLYSVSDLGPDYRTEINKLTYVVFKAPLLSNPTKFAYGWLQLEIITSATDAYGTAVYIKDGAIETNVGEIYVGYH